MRIVLLGNAGSGKSTLARRLKGKRQIARLSLDEIAWKEGAERKPLAETLSLLKDFMNRNDDWIIEGCYGDLIEHALPYCEELIFLNPGVEACIAHCRSRPFEPEKFASAEAQHAMLARLIDWVADYEVRDDEYGLERHRELFDNFPGKKREFRNVAEYPGL